MIILGLLVLILAVAVAVVAIVRGGDPVTFQVGSLDFDTDGTGMFLAGAGTLLLAVVGLWLLSKGLTRSRQRRQEVRELRDRADRNDDAARRERAAAEQRDLDQTGDHTTPMNEPGRHADADDAYDSSPRDHG